MGAYCTYTNGEGVVKINLFDELLKIFRPLGLAPERVEIKMSDVFSQILLGHRLWCKAATRKERFINVEHVAMRHNKEDHEIWANIELSRPDFARLPYNQNDLLEKTGMGDEFSLVEPVSDRDVKIVLEMNNEINLSLIHISEPTRPY